MSKSEWTLITKNQGEEETIVMKVNGGEIYQTIIWKDRQPHSNAMCFVPDVDLQRYQAHLRDAYNKGYEDGHNDAKNGLDERAQD